MIISLADYFLGCISLTPNRLNQQGKNIRYCVYFPTDFWWGEENGSEKKLDLKKKKKKKRRVLLRKTRRASKLNKKLNVVKGQWTPQEDW